MHSSDGSDTEDCEVVLRTAEVVAWEHKHKIALASQQNKEKVNRKEESESRLSVLVGDRNGAEDIKTQELPVKVRIIPLRDMTVSDITVSCSSKKGGKIDHQIVGRHHIHLSKGFQKSAIRNDLRETIHGTAVQ
jgi:hypothetical protein